MLHSFIVDFPASTSKQAADVAYKLMELMHTCFVDRPRVVSKGDDQDDEYQIIFASFPGLSLSRVCAVSSFTHRDKKSGRVRFVCRAERKGFCWYC